MGVGPGRKSPVQPTYRPFPFDVPTVGGPPGVVLSPFGAPIELWVLGCPALVLPMPTPVPVPVPLPVAVLTLLLPL